MKEIFYNVWVEVWHRWTNATAPYFIDPAGPRQQDPNAPLQLTKDQAIAWVKHMDFGEVRPLVGYKTRKPKKLIPEFPLDNTLPILQAGYIQDRQRKLFKK